MKLDHHVLVEWKAEMNALLKTRFGKKYSKKEIDAYLDRQIEKHCNNRKVSLFNNYSNSSMRSSILELTDIIDENKLIITGGGCLFLPHNVKPNILIDFIIDGMDGRGKAKDERDLFEKGTDEWFAGDLLQLNKKRLLNSLYGCIGYPGFFLYNIFTAEAVTNEGKHIITTAINALDGFLGDNVPLMTPNELFRYIYNIANEKATKYPTLDASVFNITDWETRVENRLLSKCRWKYDGTLATHLREVLSNLDDGTLSMLYYKNNLMEFCQNEFIKQKVKYIIDQNGLLSFCRMDLLKGDDIREAVRQVWNFFDCFVLYDYPINDRIRKAMYIPKSRTLYTDTDSVFIGLHDFVKYVRDDIYQGKNPFIQNPKDLRYTSVNIILLFVNFVLERVLYTLCESTNIEPEYAKRLKMKNEFYLERILFIPKKKRYISLGILQEGKLLGGGKGLPEIKGFDFKKATTKPYLQQFYTQLSLDEILYTDQINPGRVFDKMCKLKEDIIQGIAQGDRKFYKQSSVKDPENYKNPYQTQGITATLLWNALCPQSLIELPGDVNIVPIKDMTQKKPKTNPDRPNQMVVSDPTSNKNIKAFAEKYPDVYARLSHEIYHNINPSIRYMTLKSIAIPKNTNIEVPQYIYDLIDSDGIVNSALTLFLPVMQSIGIHSLPSTGQANHMTNIISL